MGCGKTTVLGEASDILSGHDILHAAIDLDAVGAVLVPEEVASGLAQRNLAAIYANFVNAGVKHVLLAEAVETRADLDGLCGAMPGADFVICRLTAAPATMERRLRRD